VRPPPLLSFAAPLLPGAITIDASVSQISKRGALYTYIGAGIGARF
jgi:hypothetical protein